MMAWQVPELWLGGATRFVRQMSWWQLIHGFALILASLPFALALRLLRAAHPVRWAFGIALAGLALPTVIPAVRVLLDFGMTSWGSCLCTH